MNTIIVNVSKGFEVTRQRPLILATKRRRQDVKTGLLRPILVIVEWKKSPSLRRIQGSGNVYGIARLQCVFYDRAHVKFLIVKHNLGRGTKVPPSLVIGFIPPGDGDVS